MRASAYRADARWLLLDNVPPYRVAEGDVIVITEGHRIVAYFHVEYMDFVV